MGALLAAVTLPALIEQARNLIEHEPELRNKLADWLAKSHVLAPLAQSLKHVQYGSLAKASAGSALLASTRVFEFMGYLLSSVFLALYIMIDRDRLRGALFAVVPRHYHIRLSRVLINLEAIVGGYIRGQALTSGLMVVFAFILLAVCGVSNALAIAVFAGLADVLPYIGAVLLGAAGSGGCCLAGRGDDDRGGRGHARLRRVGESVSGAAHLWQDIASALVGGSARAARGRHVDGHRRRTARAARRVRDPHAGRGVARGVAGRKSIDDASAAAREATRALNKNTRSAARNARRASGCDRGGDLGGAPAALPEREAACAAAPDLFHEAQRAPCTARRRPAFPVRISERKRSRRPQENRAIAGSWREASRERTLERGVTGPDMRDAERRGADAACPAR